MGFPIYICGSPGLKSNISVVQFDCVAVVSSTVVQNFDYKRVHMYSRISDRSMRPTLNGSSVLQHFECGNAVKIATE